MDLLRLRGWRVVEEVGGSAGVDASSQDVLHYHVYPPISPSLPPTHPQHLHHEVVLALIGGPLTAALSDF